MIDVNRQKQVFDETHWQQNANGQQQVFETPWHQNAKQVFDETPWRQNVNRQQQMFDNQCQQRMFDDQWQQNGNEVQLFSYSVKVFFQTSQPIVDNFLLSIVFS